MTSHTRLPKLLTNTSKSSKDERERVDQIARGLHMGDTPQNTISSLKQLKQLLAEAGAKEPSASDGGAPSESKVIDGKTYNKINGQWFQQ